MFARLFFTINNLMQFVHTSFMVLLHLYIQYILLQIVNMKKYLYLTLFLFPFANQAQNVGIGTTTPTEKLEIKNPLRNTIKISSNNFTDTTELYLSNRNNSNQGTDFSIKNIREEGLFFSSVSDISGNTSANSLVIKPTGNIGIGIVPSSANRLHVNGISNFNGLTKIEGANLFEFGAGVVGKEINAGKIGYNAFGQNALTFIGAGTNITNRSVYFFAEAGTTMNGPLNIGGPLSVNGNAGTTGQVLTSNGTADPTWTNTAYSNNIRFAATLAASTINVTPTYSTIYNLSPADVSIASTGITISHAGLYRIEGYLTITANYNTEPTSIGIDMSFNLKGSNFDIIKRQLPNRNFNSFPFIYEYTTHFQQDYYFNGTGNVTVGSSVFVTGSPVLNAGSISGKITGYLIND